MDGSYPESSLVQGTNGKFYGTAGGGGAFGDGTVFSITRSGTLTTLHSFDASDGAQPDVGLVQGINGHFYGTTAVGGANGHGTVFKISSSGTLTRLHSFDYTDGGNPQGALVQGTDGKFYGTAFYGGANLYGTVFKITPDGTFTILHSFDLTDGAYPYAGLVEGTDGDFYGTTQQGGAYRNDTLCNGSTCGTIFKITRNGTLTTLYSFCRGGGNCTDGALPMAGLIQGTDGNFYGTTAEGGVYGYGTYGTVFKITPSGILTTLHSFNGMDGADPEAGLIQATDGNFYGTTATDGVNEGGTVFKITPTGTLTTLYNFCSQSNCTDGGDPKAGLLQATNGKLYGTTSGGGTNDTCENFSTCGTVFSLAVGLGPFVKTQPTSGTVGEAVKILGTSLTGSSSVTFNGTAATFTVVSKSLITTTVPLGATTGKVKVVTPGGTLSSNVPFRVK
jgi:uncharacterized repeat protein (TIGR03803 family)